MAKIKTKNLYWTKSVDEAIERFNSCTDGGERNEIWNRYLQIPFTKLAENTSNTFKTCDICVKMLGQEQLQKELLSHLFIQVSKYKPGNNGFGYFSVIAKHWLIQLSKKFYKEQNRTFIEEISEMEPIMDTIADNSVVFPYDFNKKEYFSLMANYLEKNHNLICNTDKQRFILKKMVELLRDDKNIKNRKDLYKHLVSELGISSSTIKSIRDKITPIYKRKLKEYEEKGTF